MGVRRLARDVQFETFRQGDSLPAVSNIIRGNQHGVKVCLKFQSSLHIIEGLKLNPLMVVTERELPVKVVISKIGTLIRMETHCRDDSMASSWYSNVYLSVGRSANSRKGIGGEPV